MWTFYRIIRCLMYNGVCCFPIVLGAFFCFNVEHPMPQRIMTVLLYCWWQWHIAIVFFHLLVFIMATFSIIFHNVYLLNSNTNLQLCNVFILCTQCHLIIFSDCVVLYIISYQYHQQQWLKQEQLMACIIHNYIKLYS